MGDLSLTDMKKIHAQILGQKVTEAKEEEKKDEKEEAKGNELTFKKLHLNLSREIVKKDQTVLYALILQGEVTFNETASADALLQINNDGLTISGGLADYQIPDTCVTIKQARLHVFIGFNSNKKDKKDKTKDDKDSKQVEPTTEGAGAENTNQSDNAEKAIDVTTSEAVGEKNQAAEKPGQISKKKVAKPDSNSKTKKRENEFAILGIVRIENVTVSVGIYTARKKGKSKRDWLLFGSVSSVALRELNADVGGTFLDLQLDNVALIASSDYIKVEDEDDETKKDEKGEKDKNKGTEKKNAKPEKGVVKADSKKGKDQGKQDQKGDKEEDKDKHAHAGVLKTVKSYKYPIRKGK